MNSFHRVKIVYYLRLHTLISQGFQYGIHYPPAMPRRRTLLLSAIFLAILIFLFNQLRLVHRPETLSPSNSTLGFGTIIAVSHVQSPRRPALLWAANLTDLEIVIPEQREWTEGDLQEFRANESSTISRGSALAWLGHLNALKW